MYTLRNNRKIFRSKNQQQKCCCSIFPAFSAAVVTVQFFTTSWFPLHCASPSSALFFSHTLLSSSPPFVVSAISKIFKIKPSISLSFVCIHRARGSLRSKRRKLFHKMRFTALPVTIVILLYGQECFTEN